jgi:hypothetical protein
MDSQDEPSRGIGTLQENALHAALKRWYAHPGDELEAPLDGFIIDIRRGDLLIEIQTRNFSAIRPKLERLCAAHTVRLVHPIPRERWIIKDPGPAGGRLERRKSPRRGTIEQVFSELVRLPHLLAHPNFSVEVLLTHEEEVRVNDGQGSWRRKGWSIQDRRLVEVVGRAVLACPEDYLALLPTGLAEPFTNRQLAAALGQPVRVAQKMTYCLRRAGWLHQPGQRGRSHLYSKELP